MAKGSWIGIDSKARKIKKAFIGIDGKARKIKKMWIGIADKARLFFSGGELSYYGTVEAKYWARGAGASNSNYALFAGGYGMTSTTVTAYNSTLTMSTPTTLAMNVKYLGGTSVGNYALFGGGISEVSYNGSTYTVQSAEVNAYDTSLTRTQPDDLGNGRGHIATASNGSYGIFSGGVQMGGGAGEAVSLANTEAYNSALTVTYVSNTPSYPLYYGAGAKVGNYALFGGGNYTAGPGPRGYVWSYDTSLTFRSTTDLSNATYQLASASVGNYALFAGGMNSSISYIDSVDAYNTSLTKSKATAMSAGRRSFAGASVGEYAIFTGGISTDGYGSTSTDVYDTSLTRTNSLTLSIGRYTHVSATIGNYAIFTGGDSNGTKADVFQAG